MSHWNFKNRTKTELCLAHYRVPRGLGLVSCYDVVSGTCIHGILYLSIDFLLHKCKLSKVSIRTLGIMPAGCVAETLATSMKHRLQSPKLHHSSSHLPARARPLFAWYWAKPLPHSMGCKKIKDLIKSKIFFTDQL